MMRTLRVNLRRHQILLEIGLPQVMMMISLIIQRSMIETIRLTILMAKYNPWPRLLSHPLQQ